MAKRNRRNAIIASLLLAILVFDYLRRVFVSPRASFKSHNNTDRENRAQRLQNIPSTLITNDLRSRSYNPELHNKMKLVNFPEV